MGLAWIKACGPSLAWVTNDEDHHGGRQRRALKASVHNLVTIEADRSFKVDVYNGYAGAELLGVSQFVEAEMRSTAATAREEAKEICMKKWVFVFVAAEYETPKNALNQIFLWDGIIPEHAKLWIHTSNKYYFIDQGSNLLGKEFNLTLHCHVMPKTGKMFIDKIVMLGYRLPEECR